jgi:Ras-related C3 botulinum toxin substrate 1
MTVHLKTVAVGHGAVGKTCMYIRYATGNFPEEYVPTVFDNYSAERVLDGQSYELGLWDTAGGEDYPRLRPLSYPNTDVFLLLFSVDDSLTSFEDIFSYWWAELKHHCPDVPIILVGSKIDLRHNGAVTITTESGEAMAKKIRAAKYMEISSLQDRGVTELFEEVLRVGHHYQNTKKGRRRRKKRKCIIL